MQLLHWESTSGYCPRCGAATERIENEWEALPKMPVRALPHLYPAVIILVHDGDRCCYPQADWAPGRYA